MKTMKLANLRNFGSLTILALLLAGCTAAPITQEVKIPVFTPCVKAMPARPTFEAPALATDANDGEKVIAFARDTLLHFKYEGQLEAVIAGCL